MSALPPKADMCSAQAHVRFGPIADILRFTRSIRRRAAGATPAEGTPAQKAEFRPSIVKLTMILPIQSGAAASAAALLRLRHSGDSCRAAWCSLSLAVGIGANLKNVIPTKIPTNCPAARGHARTNVNKILIIDLFFQRFRRVR